MYSFVISGFLSSTTNEHLTLTFPLRSPLQIERNSLYSANKKKFHYDMRSTPERHPCEAPCHSLAKMVYETCENQVLLLNKFIIKYKTQWSSNETEQQYQVISLTHWKLSLSHVPLIKCENRCREWRDTHHPTSRKTIIFSLFFNHRGHVTT